MPSMSDENAIGCSLKHSKSPKILLRRPGRDSRHEFNDKPFNFEEAMSTRLTFPDLFGLVTR